MPPTPPQVQFYQGMLSISAQNATLGDILNAVKAQSGTLIDMPAEAAAQRVVFNMGPAPARDVLSSLLKGISYDYIIVGSREDSQRIQRVMLTSKRGTDVPDATSRNPVLPQNGIISPPVRNADDEEEDAGGVIMQPTQALPVEAAPRPVSPNPVVAPRTREQMLQELMQRRQTPQAPPSPPPYDPD